MASAMPFAPNTPAYHDHFVAWLNQRLLWALIGAVVIIVSLGGVISYLAVRPHNNPWVIALDHGKPTAQVIPLEGSAAIADSTIRWAVGEYIENAFSISPDFLDEKTRLTRAYHMSTDKVGDVLSAYYHDNKGANDPLKNTFKSWQEVRVLDTLKLATPNNYQVDYTILRYDAQHKYAPTITYWKATLLVVQGPPKDDNPLGLWVKYLNFGQEAK